MCASTEEMITEIDVLFNKLKTDCKLKHENRGPIKNFLFHKINLMSLLS